MDLVQLRDILRPLNIALKDAGTHEMLPAMCESLGLHTPDNGVSKRERLTATLDATPDVAHPEVAQRYLQLCSPAENIRNQIQDLLWADSASPDIPKRFRHEVARALQTLELYLNASRFDALLDDLWVLDSGDLIEALFGRPGRSLRAEIERHVHRNPDDWSVGYLLDRLGAFDASNRRFALFLEGLASADVRPDEKALFDLPDFAKMNWGWRLG